MPEPDPSHNVSKESLAELLVDLDAVRGLVGKIGGGTIPLALAVAKAKIRILTTKGRVHRMIDAALDDAPAGDQIPTPAEALAHLAAARGGPQPELSPTVLETPIGVPEVIGPAVYVPEAAMPSEE
ncbi:hypothetical protein [Acidisphaera sp. S103]|uniref:hypothetical protein n=1 Tax=Acidisphaera sp. S103 TaxID=1747223 RepID=UPI00131AA5B2|nr:hypothetical protein [Acidisphaera sp. S103]